MSTRRTPRDSEHPGSATIKQSRADAIPTATRGGERIVLGNRLDTRVRAALFRVLSKDNPAYTGDDSRKT